MAVPSPIHRIKLRELNRHLVCRLCRGYYVDATTISECLHSFCRSCIIKYLEKNSFCPICEVQINITKPHLSLKLDKTLQDVVYKLVPGMYQNEMKRRRTFYQKHRELIPTTIPEQSGVEERIIFSPEDFISLSLEYSESDDLESENVSSKSSENGDYFEGCNIPQNLSLMKLKNEGVHSRRKSQKSIKSNVPKRYFQCPAIVSMRHLKKFIRRKHNVGEKIKVDIIHKRVLLPDHYTLMDVAYIYTWKRNSPMRLFFKINRPKERKFDVPPAAPETLETSLEISPEKTVINGNLPNDEVKTKPIEKQQISFKSPPSRHNVLSEKKTKNHLVKNSNPAEVKTSGNVTPEKFVEDDTVKPENVQIVIGVKTKKVQETVGVKYEEVESESTNQEKVKQNGSVALEKEEYGKKILAQNKYVSFVDLKSTPNGKNTLLPNIIQDNGKLESRKIQNNGYEKLEKVQDNSLSLKLERLKNTNSTILEKSQNNFIAQLDRCKKDSSGKRELTMYNSISKSEPTKENDHGASELIKSSNCVVAEKMHSNGELEQMKNHVVAKQNTTKIHVPEKPDIGKNNNSVKPEQTKSDNIATQELNKSKAIGEMDEIKNNNIGTIVQTQNSWSGKQKSEDIITAKPEQNPNISNLRPMELENKSNAKAEQLENKIHWKLKNAKGGAQIEILRQRLIAKLQRIQSYNCELLESKSQDQKNFVIKNSIKLQQLLNHINATQETIETNSQKLKHNKVNASLEGKEEEAVDKNSRGQIKQMERSGDRKETSDTNISFTSNQIKSNATMETLEDDCNTKSKHTKDNGNVERIGNNSSAKSESSHDNISLVSKTIDKKIGQRLKYVNGSAKAEVLQTSENTVQNEVDKTVNIIPSEFGKSKNEEIQKDASNLGESSNLGEQSEKSDCSKSKQSVELDQSCVSSSVDPFKKKDFSKSLVESIESVQNNLSTEPKQSKTSGKEVEKTVENGNMTESKGDEISLSESIVQKSEKFSKCEEEKPRELDGKETPKEEERLLLNPISGHLESVPSTNEETLLMAVREKQKNGADSADNEPVVKSSSKTESESQDCKNSSMNLLKSFRKEKNFVEKDSKLEMKLKVGEGGSLIITPISKTEASLRAETTKASVEIKKKNIASEYDFDLSNPSGKGISLQEFPKFSRPSKFLSEHKEKWLSKEFRNSWQSLQNFREQKTREDETNEEGKRPTRKSLPSLNKINLNKNKNAERNIIANEKDDKPKKIPSSFKENEDRKKEMGVEVSKGSPPRRITIENKGGEYSIKKTNKEPPKFNGEVNAKFSPESKKGEVGIDLKRSSPRPIFEKESENKRSRMEEEEGNAGPIEAIDLSKSEVKQRQKAPLENLIERAKSESTKTDEKMVETLITAAQKQSMEPLLRIPQYSQNLNTHLAYNSGKIISPCDISQALQFFRDLNSDLKFLQAKSQFNPNSLTEQFPKSPINADTLKVYQQQMEFVKTLKRRQMEMNNFDHLESPQNKAPKLTFPFDQSEKPLLFDELKPKKPKRRRGRPPNLLNLPYLQSQPPFQNGFMPAHNYRNFAPFLQYYNGSSPYRSTPKFSSATSSKLRTSSHSSKSQNSIRLLVPPRRVQYPTQNPDPSFLNSSKDMPYANPSSKMTFNQMFEKYVNQQESNNQNSPDFMNKSVVYPPLINSKSFPNFSYNSLRNSKNSKSMSSS